MSRLLLGLPRLSGPLLAKARELSAPVLVSANSFSRWRKVPPLTRMVGGKAKVFPGYPEWSGFGRPKPGTVESMDVALDSAGFVAAAKYRGWPWTPSDYMDLCASAPWTWFASMDWCVEPEVAHDEEAVLDRISGTVRLNVQCLLEAERRGIRDRFVPVIQGWDPSHYIRCVDRLSGVLDGFRLVGVGSMCRRHVEGRHGLLQIVEILDRTLPRGVLLHLFGIKSQGMEELRGHPRIASFDSQSYGVRARREAIERGVPKTDRFVAAVMEEWFCKQNARLTKPRYRFRTPNECLDFPASSKTELTRRIQSSADELRTLLEHGEIGWSDLNQRMIFEGSFNTD